LRLSGFDVILQRNQDYPLDANEVRNRRTCAF